MHTRTKIVCTIGPAVESYEKILELIDAGMNVARLNFSHGTHEEHLRVINFLKKARDEKNVALAIMLDTHGPKIRVGELPNGAISLKPGDIVKLDEIPIQPAEVVASILPGMTILFDDGYIVAEVAENGIRIKNAGVLKSGKGVSIPGAQIMLPALTESDIEDIRFGCLHDVDFIAASFIRSDKHIVAIKTLLEEEGKPDIQVIAKIESTQGIENFDRILRVADGIMVARGDLGVELDLALVPSLQKMMIRKGNFAGKPVVTATQMLESMINNPRPTRAEVSDVANAIYDGTSLVMLSGETAVGKYPIETVKRMRSIVQASEADFPYHDFFASLTQKDHTDAPSAVSIAAVKTAHSINAKCIFALTTSGRTARLISRLRPPMPIIAVTPSKKYYHQLIFDWGVIPVLAAHCTNMQEAFAAAREFAMANGFITSGDMVVITAGTPFGQKGTTNMIIVETIT